MPVTLDQLSAAVHGFFTQKLTGVSNADAPGSVVLVFDGLGSPLSAKEFGVGATGSQQQLLAHQRAAQLADQLPAANGLANGWYLPRDTGRLSLWYKALLTGSATVSAGEQAMKAFELGKAAALKRLELNESIQIGGVGDGPGVDPTGVHDKIYQTGMSPPDWFLPESDVWQASRFDGTQPIPPTPPPIPVPLFDAQVLVPMPDIPGFTPASVVLRAQPGESVSEGDPLANIRYSSDEIPNHTVSNVLLAPAAGTLLKVIPDGDRVEAGDQLAVIGVRRRTAVASAQNVISMPEIDKPSFVSTVEEWHKEVGDDVAIDESLVDIRFFDTTTDEEVHFVVRSPVSGVLIEIDKVIGEVVEAGTPLAIIAEKPVGEPAAPQGFTVEFDFCVVSFDRPWWDEVFLTSTNWGVAGFGRGQIASGTVANTASAAVTLITSGMVVVRNLAITSNWAAEERDQLTAGALNLGPFSLTGAAVHGQTLTRRGMQALGWICQVPPILPPANAPA